MTPSPERELLGHYLPENVFTYFDVTSSNKTDQTMNVSLTEKNIPPKEDLRFKGFRNITISDYPVRGRETRITFKRRVWVDTDGKSVKTDIPLTFPGTKLEKEFALFLKEES